MQSERSHIVTEDPANLPKIIVNPQPVCITKLFTCQAYATKWGTRKRAVFCKRQAFVLMSTEVTPNDLSWGKRGPVHFFLLGVKTTKLPFPDSVDNFFPLNFPKLKLLIGSSYTESLFILAKPTGETQ